MCITRKGISIAGRTRGGSRRPSALDVVINDNNDGDSGFVDVSVVNCARQVDAI
jgi:hypothetical protein